MELTLGFPERGSGNPEVSSTNPPVLRGSSRSLSLAASTFSSVDVASCASHCLPIVSRAPVSPKGAVLSTWWSARHGLATLAGPHRAQLLLPPRDSPRPPIPVSSI